MVYFLGVAVMQSGSRLCVDTDDVQRELMDMRHHFAGVFTGMRNVAFNREVKGEAVCEGFWTLALGVYKGEHLRRRHQLERFLSTLQRGTEGLDLCYAYDQKAFCVRLLVCDAGGAREFRWGLLPDETLVGFEEALTCAVPLRMGLTDMSRVQALDKLAYAARLRAAGLSWVGNA